MKITPLAADSFGARSMATLVETPDLKILIDPGVRLGPYRYDLPPHEIEEDRRRDLWRGFPAAGKKAALLRASPYPFDPPGRAAPSSPKGKGGFRKTGSSTLNRAHRGRGTRSW